MSGCTRARLFNVAFMALRQPTTRLLISRGTASILRRSLFSINRPIIQSNFRPLFRVLPSLSTVSQIQWRHLSIETQDTPNPQSMKYLPGCEVMESGQTFIIRKIEDAKVSPLATGLMQLEGVTNIMFGSDFITVSKKDEYTWDIITPEVSAIISDHFSSGQPLFTKEHEEAVATKPEGEGEGEASETEMMIQELLDVRIRPVIQEDGGDVEFVKFAEGTVYLKLHGACGTCPSSSATLKGGIENMLMHYCPEVEAVEQILDESEITSNQVFEDLEKRLGN